MLIYTSQITPRIEFIFDFMLKETMSVDYELTTNKELFTTSNLSQKWSYGYEFDAIACLPASNFLFEKTIVPQELDRIEKDYIIGIFKSESIQNINFDIFASAFYLISRYEEYLPCVLDEHGRYAALQSVAFQFGFLDKAMVNRYIFWLISWLKDQFPETNIKLEKPKFLFSIDIDHPFYSKDVSIDKWLIRSIKNGSMFNENDKYDSFEFILEQLGELKSIFFFLCPENPSDMDHLNKRNSENFKQLIQFIKSKSQIGIHPSYYAESKKLLGEEIEWMSLQHQRPIKSSRFHYLRWNIETSPHQLIKYGIQYDFSLAYSTHVGFRASTSHPFFLYDFKKERKSNLKIFSPCIMDSSFKYGTISNFREKCSDLIDEIKTYGGSFIPIFHNDILSDDEWKDNFKYCINSINR